MYHKCHSAAVLFYNSNQVNWMCRFEVNTDHNWFNPSPVPISGGACINNYNNGFIWGVNTYLCPNFNDGIAESPLKLGHEWTCTSHSFIIYPCPKPVAGSANLKREATKFATLRASTRSQKGVIEEQHSTREYSINRWLKRLASLLTVKNLGAGSPQLLCTTCMMLGSYRDKSVHIQLCSNMWFSTVYW